MTWTKLPDDFADRPALLEISRSARLLNIEALIWCNRHLRDGLLPRGALARLTDSPDPLADVAELVAAGEWTEVATGWLLDWTDQELAEDVRARQEHRADKQKRYRRRKALHEQGDHTECDPRYCPRVTSNVTGLGDRNVTGLVTPSRPVPSRPLTGDRDTGEAPAAQARRSPAHQWRDDGSGISCADCALPASHRSHRDEAAS